MATATLSGVAVARLTAIGTFPAATAALVSSSKVSVLPIASVMLIV